MPAKSKSQQRLFGMVHACQKHGKCASPEVSKMADSIKEKDATDFAKTKHKGLPEKKKKKKTFKEFLESKGYFEEVSYPFVYGDEVEGRFGRRGTIVSSGVPGNGTYDVAFYDVDWEDGNHESSVPGGDLKPARGNTPRRFR